MAKNKKKPKFLEKETPELLTLLKAALDGDDVDIPRALKITDELISRQPGEEASLSVDEALHKAADSMTQALNIVKEAYDSEISNLDDGEEEDDEEEPAAKPKKGKKKAKPDEEEDDEEEDSDDDGDDEEGEDYSDWSLKDLKKECRTRGIKVTKGMSKAEMVKALEADDQE